MMAILSTKSRGVIASGFLATSPAAARISVIVTSVFIGMDVITSAGLYIQTKRIARLHVALETAPSSMVVIARDYTLRAMTLRSKYAI